MEPVTIFAAVSASWRVNGNRSALTYHAGTQATEYTHAELQAIVHKLRSALWASGLRPGDRAALLSENRPEWAIADLACQSLGIVTIPIYPTIPQIQVEHILNDCMASIAFGSTKEQVAKLVQSKPNCSTLKHIIGLDVSDSTDSDAWSDLLGTADSCDKSPNDFDLLLGDVSPDATATIIYTSGTTGLPKGAELSHTALLHTGIAARTIVPLDHSDVFLSFLPLSHIIERVGGHYLPLTIGAHIVYSQGVTALKKEITGVRPTVFLSVPRVFEYIQEAVFDQLPKQPPLKQKMFHIAVGIGDKVAILHSRGKRPGPFLNIAYGIAKKLVLEKVRERVTGGRDRFFVSGGAPLNAVTAKFFNALGVCLLEGYGLTECPVITLNRPGKSMPGTVGQVIPGMEVKIAEDGEILSRGPSRMRCYNGNPQATADAIDSDGWFHTGDIGNFDDMQRLRIVDRKKDIIVLANGKNVAPLPIEALLKSNPMIQEAVLIGDKQATISALIIPNWDQIAAALPELSISAKEPDAWLDNADVKKLIRKQLDTVAGSLADFERVKQFRLLAKPFSIEGGELTPTLKVKRKTVQEKYASLIAEMSK